MRAKMAIESGNQRIAAPPGHRANQQDRQERRAVGVKRKDAIEDCKDRGASRRRRRRGAGDGCEQLCRRRQASQRKPERTVHVNAHRGRAAYGGWNGEGDGESCANHGRGRARQC